MGTAGKVSYEQLENSISAGYLSEEDLEGMDVEPEGSIQWAFEGVESTPQSELSHVLNGFHSDDVVGNFGDGAKVRVKIASKNEVDAAHERYTNVRFYVSKSKQAPLQRKRAELQVGELERETFEEWAQENGFGNKL
jgi:hypothetical protein